jgi:polar amino acid transport system substrate-binding protein
MTGIRRVRKEGTLTRIAATGAENMFKKLTMSLVIGTGLMMGTGSADAETWTVTSLGWQPFSGPDMPEQGAGIHALREALKTEGIDLEVRFMPWKRAKAVAANDDSVVGYYPSWPSEVIDGFFASETVFTSPVGFAERSDDGISWQTPRDLTQYMVGTVGAYIYPDSFQKLVDDGSVRTTEVDDDATALRMVGAGRVDTAAIDKYVMQYQLNTNPGLSGMSGDLSFDEKTLIDYDLVIAFVDNADNRGRAETLKAALGNVDTQKLISEYLDGLK